MGSLMAGWDRHVEDPKSVRYKRNKSLTKEEIEAYWKEKKKIEKEHLGAVSMDESKGKESPVEMENEVTTLEDAMKKNAWKVELISDGPWTRSNWAFLNEPPVVEAAPNRYASQFHVANVSKFSPNHGISAN